MCVCVRKRERDWCIILLCVCVCQSDPSGIKLKELIMEKGITSSAVEYLRTKVPPKL